MSVQNFKPIIWAKKILQELDKQHGIIMNCNRSYEGEIKDKGSKVKINSLKRPTIVDYVPNSTTLTPQELVGEEQFLEITQAKAFSIYIDDVDEKQTTGGVLSEGLRLSLEELMDTAEQFVITKFADAGNTVTEASLTSGNFFSTFMKAKRKLMRNGNVKESMNICADVTPEVWEKGVLADILYNNQDNGDMIRKGQYVESLGMTFFVSNNIPVVETNEDVVAQTCCIRTVKRAIAYAEQINKVERYRPESAFQDAIKGLHLYGAKMILPKEACKMVLTTAAETLV